jgi:hypothetical protein
MLGPPHHPSHTVTCSAQRAATATCRLGAIILHKCLPTHQPEGGCVGVRKASVHVMPCSWRMPARPRAREAGRTGIAGRPCTSPVTLPWLLASRCLCLCLRCGETALRRPASPLQRHRAATTSGCPSPKTRSTSTGAGAYTVLLRCRRIES